MKNKEHIMVYVGRFLVSLEMTARCKRQKKDVWRRSNRQTPSSSFTCSIVMSSDARHLFAGCGGSNDYKNLHAIEILSVVSQAKTDILPPDVDP